MRYVSVVMVLFVLMVACGKDSAPTPTPSPAPVETTKPNASPVAMADASVDAETRENGVVVRSASEPAGCSTKKFSKGFCERTMAECKNKTFMYDCEPADAYACFDRGMRTSGKTIELCSETYGQCVTRAEDMKQDPETASVTECVIYRYVRN